MFEFQGPTWNTLKMTFLMLGLSLAVILGLAFSSSDSALTLHVIFLVLITAGLFSLLSWYISYSLDHVIFELFLCLLFKLSFVYSISTISG